jgi:CxxC motif-containing protein (DUF1111 family)
MASRQAFGDGVPLLFALSALLFTRKESFVRRLRSAPILVALIFSCGVFALLASTPAVEAPTGFSTPSLTDNPGSQSENNGLAYDGSEDFAELQKEYEEEEGVDKGLGPLYNAQSCVGCHQNPVTGGSGQISELRVGHRDGSGRFVNPNIVINNGSTVIRNRSLVNDRAICAEAQERVPDTEKMRTFRMSLSTLGDGFVEAIADQTLINISNAQRMQTGGRISGEVIRVPVLEAPGKTRVGRFGWKDQHASLLSFSADAYLNEQGITSRLMPVDTTSVCDNVPDPEDDDDGSGKADIDRFTEFMRGTKAPPTDPVAAAKADAQAGAVLFARIGCAHCHVTSITTAAPGTAINGGTFVVPEALGNKIIHPYGDYLLHDVGTGDGFVQNGPVDTANKFRTAPLWGLRTRDRLMHDGLSFTRQDAILRHRGEAAFVIRNYRSLSFLQRNQLLQFLNTL